MGWRVNMSTMAHIVIVVVFTPEDGKTWIGMKNNIE